MRGNQLWRELEKEHSRQRKQQTKNSEAVRAPKPYAVNWGLLRNEILKQKSFKNMSHCISGIDLRSWGDKCYKRDGINNPSMKFHILLLSLSLAKNDRLIFFLTYVWLLDRGGGESFHIFVAIYMNYPVEMVDIFRSVFLLYICVVEYVTICLPAKYSNSSG